MQIIHPGSAGTGTLTLTLDVDPGIIISASVFTPANSETPFSLWIDFGLSAPPYDISTRRMSLLTGYLSSYAPLSWSGHHLLTDATVLYLTLVGDLTLPVLASADKLSPSNTPTLKRIYDAISRPS